MAHCKWYFHVDLSVTQVNKNYWVVPVLSQPSVVGSACMLRQIDMRGYFCPMYDLVSVHCPQAVSSQTASPDFIGPYEDSGGKCSPLFRMFYEVVNDFRWIQGVNIIGYIEIIFVISLFKSSGSGLQLRDFALVWANTVIIIITVLIVQ